MKSRYQSDSKSDIIANSYFDIVDTYDTCVKYREINGVEHYQISNGNMRELALRILSKSSLLKDFRYIYGNTYEKYANDKFSADSLLSLLSILDLVSYEVCGGKNPEIFIRLNAPDKIKNIIEDKVLYTNSYSTEAKKKHYRSVKILDYFFKNFKNDDFDNRWDFIEKYFLGEDIEKEIDSEISNGEEVKFKDMDKYIDKQNAIHVAKDSCWGNIISDYFNQDTFVKYNYYCKLLKDNNVQVPDYLFASICLPKDTIDTMFVYEQKHIIIVDEKTSYNQIVACEKMGWNIIKINEIENYMDKLM